MAALQTLQLHVYRCSLRSPLSSGETSSKASTISFSFSSLAQGQHSREGLNGPASRQPRRTAGRLVIEAKGRKSHVPPKAQNLTSQRMAPKLPDLDPNDQTPYFTIFIRGVLKSGMALNWQPLTLIAGGSATGPVLQAMSSPFGKKLLQSYLTRNMAIAFTKDGATMVGRAREIYPELADAVRCDFGYKVLDKKNPKNGFKTADIIYVPPETDLKSPIDKVRDLVTNFLPK